MSFEKNHEAQHQEQSQQITSEGGMSMMPPVLQLQADQKKCSLCGGECEGECSECKEKNEKGQVVLNALKPFGFGIEEQVEDKEPVQMKAEVLQLHTAADCDEWKEDCDEGCRRLPNRTRWDKAKRQLCWAACINAYATCLATSNEALTFAAIVAAIVLACADGPFPIGDAAAAAILISVGITP